MILLDDWELDCGGQERRIELYWGDLASISPQHSVDLLVVSAFPNDYLPTPTSLIGALHRSGISVHALSFDKQKDMRAEFSCWLSRPLSVRSFGRILCIESGWRGTPPELADDLFRAIAPVSVGEFAPRSVAMPLIGAGDQGYPATDMLESILKAAVSWLRRGMPVEVLKIVVYSDQVAVQARRRFAEFRDSAQEQGGLQGSESKKQWDVFLSYAHADAAVAEEVRSQLLRARQNLRVFHDRTEMRPGSSWLMQIAEAIDSSHCVLPIYTPSYWTSTPCKDELTAGYVRQARGARRVLFPIFFRDTPLMSYFEAIQYLDCREADRKKLEATCRDICAALPK